MKLLLSLLFVLGVCVSSFLSCTEVSLNAIPPVGASGLVPVKKTLRSFSSEQELSRFLRALAEKARRGRRDAAKVELSTDSKGPVAAPEPSVAGEKDDESITNVQHAGVDEGGIVKLHGKHLIVLRRGRLFSVAVGDGDLKPISAVDAFGQDIDPGGTWYDEMLVSGDTIVVIGYSYQRGGTEVGLFNIDPDGRISYRYTYHLRSNDYYSSRNYASRLIGSKLIFYTPLYLDPETQDPFLTFPAVRKWHKGATQDEFHRIVSATQVYRSEAQLNPDNGLALHTVTVCDLANGGFDCKATAVIGPPGRVFYVSPDAVYVWATSWIYDAKQTRARSEVFRMPLDGSGPSALGVSGSPIDQFSFLQSEDAYLNVVVRSDGSGDGMFAAEYSAGDVALMRVPISDFSDGTQMVPPWRYRKLVRPQGYTFQNRFVGDYLIYGTGSGWGYPENTKQSNLFLVRWARGDSHQLSLSHGVDRIEQMGSDAVVVGTDGKNLHFTAVRLGSWPEIASRYTRKEASQGELRSHGFFYKPDGDESGMLGLPISTPARPGYRHLFDSSASILFLRNQSLSLEEVGALDSQPDKAINDQCRASCIDWYGNARPLFMKGRVFALLGYEIVEGHIEGGRMRELRRVNYAPVTATVSRSE